MADLNDIRYGEKFPTSETGAPVSSGRQPRLSEVGRYLFVPYEERKDAARLGARFDDSRKAWFVPAGRDDAPFARWHEEPRPLTTAEIASEFGAFCESLGLVLDGPPVMDGKWQSVTVSTSKSTKAKKGSYVGEIPPGGRPHGFVTNHDTGEKERWVLQGQFISEADREANRRLAEENRLQRETEAKTEREKIASESARKWGYMKPADPKHPYLVRKGVDSFGLRQQGDKLVTAICDADGKIWSLQYVNPAGDKLFVPGGAKTGNFHILGELSEGKTVLFAEGYATCASLRMATGLPVVEVFDASSIAPVMEALRDHLKGRDKIICGDDDVLTHDRIHQTLSNQISSDFARPKLLLPAIDPGEVKIDGVSRQLQANPDCTIRLEYQLSPEGVQRVVGEVSNKKTEQRIAVKIVNLGREKALAAAMKFDAKAVFPVFASMEGRPTDFNDLHDREGLPAVRRQVGRAMMLARPEMPPAQSSALDVAKAAIGSAAVVRPAQRDGRYVGTVVGRTGSQAVQDVGRETAVAHELDKLDRVPAIGQQAHIAYNNGLGRVGSVAERTALGISR